MKLLFCPRCHRQVELPPMLRDGKVKMEGGGTVNITCGNCKRGRVVVRPDDLKVASDGS